MDNITDVRVEPCTNSRFIRPKRIHYKQNGVEKIWDAMKTHDAVAILLFNSSRNVFVCVKQFRPAVYINAAGEDLKDGFGPVDSAKHPGSLGITIEYCAGIIDKDIPVIEIAKQEVLEECGYEVPVEKLQKITAMRGGVGINGSHVHLYYAEVTDEMKVGPGGGLVQEGEMIEVVELSLDEGKKLIFDESVNRTGGLLFGIYWFFSTIMKNKI